jgi:hypothetical protein
MRRFQVALLVLLALLMPLRAFAMMPAAGEPAQQTQVPPCHEPEPASDDCGKCTDHGCCASYVAPAAPVFAGAAAPAQRISLGARFSAGFVPDHLDPPPLAL